MFPSRYPHPHFHKMTIASPTYMPQTPQEIPVPLRSPRRPSPIGSHLLMFRVNYNDKAHHQLGQDEMDEVSSQEFPFSQYGQSPPESIFSIPSPQLSATQVDVVNADEVGFSGDEDDELLEELVLEFDPFDAEICTISDIVIYRTSCLAANVHTTPKLV